MMTPEIEEALRAWKREEAKALLADCCEGFTDTLYDKADELGAIYYQLKREHRNDNAK